MPLKVYAYSRCDTCRKALRWLNDHQKKYELFDITLEWPTLAELKNYWQKSGLPLKDFFNKSGEVYRQLNLKETLKTLSELEQLKLLSENGRLLKRPLITDGKRVTIGFKEELFEENWS